MIDKILVRLEDVYKDYKLGKSTINAVKNISVNVDECDFTVFAGASGSGKTTVLNLIGLIDKPTSGKIWLEKDNLTTGSLNSLYTYRRDKLGYIFQTFNLIPVLSVFENVEYPLILKNISYRERKEQVNSILDKVGLLQRRKHRPAELSGGERQRVSIARAVVKNPKLILADEPTANLDSKTGSEIIDLMERMNREDGITFIFSSHDPQIINKGKKVIKLKDGEITDIRTN
jgi:putative ABC transport system ATP-binding protein